MAVPKSVVRSTRRFFLKKGEKLDYFLKMVETEVILITRCAAGIGKALAQDLNKRRRESGEPAFRVYATDYRSIALYAYFP